MATKSDTTRDSEGNVVYRGDKYPGFNKPMRSDRDGKQGKVLAAKGDEIKVIHFGDSSLEDNQSQDQYDAFVARFSGQDGWDDKFSALYWSRKWLWPSSDIGGGPKEFHTLKSNKRSYLQKALEYLSKAFDDIEGNSTISHVESDTELVKCVDSEQRRALFVVLEPQDGEYTTDLHGDTYTAEEIAKSCANFNMNCMKANIYHMVETENAIIEQSFINPAEFTTEDGRVIKSGTWLQWWYFPEDNEESETLWKSVKAGEITGVSIGGKANYEELE